MAPVNSIDDVHDNVARTDDIALADLEEELKRLSAVTDQLLHGFQQAEVEPGSGAAHAKPPADDDELELLRRENATLKARVQELEALAEGKGEELWLERQREYETLLEEKSEVIRALHQKIQEAQETQESAIGGESAPAASNTNASGTRLGQAEEILRLKRELEEQRRQLEQDEEDMMRQMRQMEMAMAKERAGLARQQQEIQRIQADLAREIENSSRDPQLRERLHSLRRSQEAKPAPVSGGGQSGQPNGQQNSGFFRRIFG
jgi:hypothetical protein